MGNEVSGLLGKSWKPKVKGKAKTPRQGAKTQRTPREEGAADYADFHGKFGAWHHFDAVISGNWLF